MAPNQRDPEKRAIKFYVTRELHLKLQQLAALRCCTMTDLLTQFVIKETSSIKLTPEDYERIAREIRLGNKY